MNFWVLLLAACSAPEPAVESESATDVHAAAVPAPVSLAVIPAIEWRVASEAMRSPAATPGDEALAAARAQLLTVVTQHARDPNNPWAIGHGMLALGKDTVLTNDKGAVDHLFAAYGEEITVGDETLIRFPTSRGDIRVEPHADLILKVLTEVGVQPNRAVVVAGNAHTVGDLYRGSLARAWVGDGSETGFASWNDSPWALQGLAAYGPEELTWTAEGGHAMTLDSFTSLSVSKLRSETAFLREAIANNTTVEKRRQFIFDYTCGGSHFYQGAAYAVGRGYGTDEDRALVAYELGVYFWRASSELAQLDSLMRSQPDYAPLLLEQRLKFTGHLLESAHKTWALGVATPTAEELVLIDVLRTQVVATVQAIDALGIWDRLEDVRAADEQVYLDYVGDSAHALRALDLSTGEGVIYR
ncbi:MAG: hypothetical protein ACJATT_002521 [Myxococcota bacterium]